MQQELNRDNAESVHLDLNTEALSVEILKTQCSNCGQDSIKYQLCKTCVKESDVYKRKMSLFAIGSGVSSLMLVLLNQNNSIFSISAGIFSGLLIHNIYSIFQI
jgi:hypothetical protein